MLVLFLAASFPLLATAQIAASQAYTPITAACPSGFTLVRQAGTPGNQTLGSEELAYITGRKTNVLPNAWKTYLSNLQAAIVSFPDYVASILGGNESSCLLNVLDGRNDTSVSRGTGGLLKAASYLTGLSELLAFGTNSSDPTEAWGGWLTQITPFRLMISLRMITDATLVYLVSPFMASLRVIPTTLPHPSCDIAIAECEFLYRFAQVYPHLDEMGSYDPTLAAFTPMKYLGATNETLCVTNLDQIGMVLGASGIGPRVYPIVTTLNATFPQRNIMLDSAVFPNAFQGPAMEGQLIDAKETVIMMSDDGSDGEAVPVQPLLVKASKAVIILVKRSSSRTKTGRTSTEHPKPHHFPTAYFFPPVPTNVSEFIAQNFSTRPTFFGCDSSTEAPLIIYVANGGPSRNARPSNVSLPELQAILDQSYLIGTQGYPASAGEATDPEWPACAVVDRARNRTGVARSGICATCLLLERLDVWVGDDEYKRCGRRGARCE
ncbi:hypothetical protein OG21DRAFT_1485081 [Imleria badia]|nr:hypothetical protein OG21DRAFT_1485081 [Imleria badia]